MSLTAEDKKYIHDEIHDAIRVELQAMHEVISQEIQAAVKAVVEELGDIIRNFMDQVDARFQDNERDLRTLRRDAEWNSAKWKKIAEAAQA